MYKHSMQLVTIFDDTGQSCRSRPRLFKLLQNIGVSPRTNPVKVTNTSKFIGKYIIKGIQQRLLTRLHCSLSQILILICYHRDLISKSIRSSTNKVALFFHIYIYIHLSRFKTNMQFTTMCRLLNTYLLEFLFRPYIHRENHINIMFALK